MMDPLVYIAVGTAQVLAILGGGSLVAFRLGRATQRMESAIELQRVNADNATVLVIELKNEVAGLKPLLTEVALQKAEITQLRRWYDELRRGEGFVYPLSRYMEPHVAPK